MTNAERDTFLKKLKPLVNRGDYRSALRLTESTYKKFPDDFTARYQYAKILGDWADELPLARQTAMKKRAVAILKPLVRSLRGKPLDERFGLCLNYYYQSKDWRAMYAFGKRFSKQNRQKSLYAQGLGATLQAFDLNAQDNIARAKTWAKKAVKAWRKYDFKSERYYFPHYSFAKALALAGKKKEAMARLRRAAKLGKRKIGDWEFADVVALL